MLWFLLACAYEPGTHPGDFLPPSSSLSGHLVLADGVPDTETRVGHVLLYDINDPPPPVGFGSPVDLATVPHAAWAYERGPVEGLVVNATASASWSLTGVPDGTWLVTALIDNDSDFSPFPGISDFAGGATCGDQVGAYVVDSTSQAPMPVTTSAPSNHEGLQLLVGAPLTTERPAFTLHDAAGAAVETVVLDPTQPVTPTTLQPFQLQSHAVSHPQLALNDPGAADCPTTFTLIRLDQDGDGAVDPHPSALSAFGFESVWPQVYLLQPQDDGTTVLSQAPIQPTYDREGPANVPFAATTLDLLFVNQGVRVELDGSQTPLVGDELPEGPWSILVVNHTGQTWLMPNNLANPAWGAVADVSQGASVVIQAP